MITWGINAMSHDAALAVFDQGQLVHASHSERYSRVKNDKNLHPAQLQEALQYGDPEFLFFYENPHKKKWRQLWAGQFGLLKKPSPHAMLRNMGVPISNYKYMDHHHSHAAYAYFTQPEFEDCDVLVIDSIGESETMTVWHGRDRKLARVFSQSYPHSVGLWYSAMTQRLGLKPQEHEYILMGMAALGDPDRYYNTIKADFFEHLPSLYDPSVRFKQNLHRGCTNWRPELNSVSDYADIAAAVQRIYEELLDGILAWMHTKSQCDRVAIVGGCALNCVANTRALQRYNSVWVPLNPGDAGSAVGAVLAFTTRPTPMSNPYLGTDIPGKYPVKEIIADLDQHGVAAVASGRAEFGPRALGHRSIVADPRLPDIKDRVNAVKQREEFRPFAPMILEEHAHRYFDMEFSAPFMQFAVPCLHPDKYPGIVHVDGTSRVQTVPKGDSGPRKLLEAWHRHTGCPMLLNTSLNIKGEPVVNTVEDAVRWTEQYKINVRTPNV
jgi:carbamoyltransferase